MQRVKCPPGSRPSCKEITIDRLPENECGTASRLVVDAFPHMSIPVEFWKKKMCFDTTIAAKENGKSIIGLANVSGREAGVVNLDLLAVDPAYQGKGLGSLLLEEAETDATKSGRGVMKLMTEQIKPKNVAFYSSRGYKVTGYDPRGYEHSPAVKLEKKI